MNKQQFIAQVADKNTMTKKDATAAVEAVLSTITDALANGESVQFIGFGTFSTSKRAAREGINPSTGDKIQIAETVSPKFKAGSKLKEAVK